MDHPDDAARLREIQARLQGWRENAAFVLGDHDIVSIFELHAADDIAWLLAQLTARETDTATNTLPPCHRCQSDNVYLVSSDRMQCGDCWSSRKLPKPEPKARETDGIEGLIREWREKVAAQRALIASGQCLNPRFMNGAADANEERANELEAALVSRATRGGRTGEDWKVVVSVEDLRYAAEGRDANGLIEYGYGTTPLDAIEAFCAQVRAVRALSADETGEEG